MRSWRWAFRRSSLAATTCSSRRPPTHWHRLLAGVARPADPRRARAAALSWFVGWDGNRTAEATDLELSAVQEQLLEWGARLSTHGVAAFLGQVWAESAVISRVLGRIDGDRAMTDLQHIAELLVLAGGRSASPTTLLATFEQLGRWRSGRRPRGRSRGPQSRVRVTGRADHDDLRRQGPRIPGGLHAVVLEQRRGHGLRQRLVGRSSGHGAPSIWPPASSGDLKTRAPSAPPWRPVRRWDRTFECCMSRSTRARHHTAVWWLPTADTWITGLARVLFARDDRGDIDPVAYGSEEIEHHRRGRVGGPARAAGRSRPRSARGGRRRRPEGRLAARGPDPTASSSVDLAVASLDRRLDRARHRLVVQRHHRSGPRPDPSRRSVRRHRRRRPRHRRGHDPGAIASRTGRHTTGAQQPDHGRPASEPAPRVRGRRAVRRAVRARRRSTCCSATSPAAPASARWSTRCWRSSTSPPPTSRPRSRRPSPTGWPGTPGRSSETSLSPASSRWCGHRSVRSSTVWRSTDLPHADRLDEMTFDLTLGEGRRQELRCGRRDDSSSTTSPPMTRCGRGPRSWPLARSTPCSPAISPARSTSWPACTARGASTASWCATTRPIAWPRPG